MDYQAYSEAASDDPREKKTAAELRQQRAWAREDRLVSLVLFSMGAICAIAGVIVAAESGKATPLFGLFFGVIFIASGVFFRTSSRNELRYLDQSRRPD